jgi:hypothetical protein
MNDLTKHRGEFLRALANQKFEVTPEGILIGGGARALAAGAFEVEHRRAGEVIGRDLFANGFTVQGLTYLLAAGVNNAAQVGTWYMAPFEGNFTPNGATLTGALFNSALTECDDYDQSTRVQYVEATPAAGATTNAANRAVFTFNASKTIYGFGLLSASAKLANGAGDVCLAAGRLGTPRPVVDDDELAVAYGLSLTAV